LVEKVGQSIMGISDGTYDTNRYDIISIRLW
jgi:hypothetical protein